MNLEQFKWSLNYMNKKCENLDLILEDFKDTPFMVSVQESLISNLATELKEIRVENELLKATLTELVTLKKMKDDGIAKQNYLKRKPLAWEAARKSLKNVGVKK